ncbi:hypothetical protein PHMEG_00020360 [Phytophthora megakarya]|uniref:Uncharacterized protein n=1 Tax=Phytophthora megakarya TaxID=4795 RepID=A0A225VR35_9STRA|nr:hypothetical protein PHMEG_00020360 [Phytophthora megakarya]
MSDSGWSDLATTTPYDYLQTPYEARPAGAMHTDYPNLYDEASIPTVRALEAAATPSGSFFTSCNQTYGTLSRKRQMFTRERKNTGFKAKTKEELRNELQKNSGHCATRAVCIFGVLIARLIAPNKEKLAHHW